MKFPLKNIAPLLLAFSFFAFSPAAFADNPAPLTVSPAVIDGNGVPQDIFNYTLTVTNTSAEQQNIFASVYELTVDGKQQFTDPASSNRPALLADWINISRGAMLFAPGETKTIPVSVTINPYATAGEYHAVIAFVEGGTRDEAEQHLDGAPQALVNFTVASNAKEELQLMSFGPDKRFYSGFPVAVNYAIKNTGDVPSVPGGEVIFYDRIGHEIGSAAVNASGTAIAPGDTQTFTVAYGGPGGSAMGQYKVGLEATYGANDAQLADTALFWVLPWRELLIIFGILLVFIIVVANWLHRRYLKRHHERRELIEHFLKTKEVRETKHVVDLRNPERKL